MTSEALVKANTLRDRANNLLREAVASGDADLWGDTIRHAMVDAAMVLHAEAAQLEGAPLEPYDVEHWAAFLPTVRVGGGLPVTFRLDGDHVLAEVIVPYVQPEDRPLENPNKIPLRIAEGFPVPVSARFRLPPFSQPDAAKFLRQVVRQLYHHEIDEQFRIGEVRTFAFEH